MNSFEHVRESLGERMRKLRDATAATRGPAPDVCNECRGTSWVIRTTNGVRRAHRCRCWYPQQAANARAGTGVPTRYAKCSFDSFTTYENEDLERALRRARGFAATFPAPQKGLLLAGPGGIGKTHLAVAILNACADKGIGGLYCDTATLLGDLRASYENHAKTREQEILHRFCKTDLLVLDDLGEEHLTQWGQDTLGRIVNTRYNHNRATVCISKLTPSPYEKDSLLWEIGGRVLSLLRQMCDAIEFDGADYRQAGEHPSAETLHKLWQERKRRAGGAATVPVGPGSASRQRAKPA